MSTGWPRPRRSIVKTHSWGEFVFDFAWARADEQRGLPLLPEAGVRHSVHARHRPAAAVPRRPAAASRCARGCCGDARAHAERHAAPRCTRCSSMSRRARPASSGGWLLRRDCHFQWHNRGYRDFDDFLSTFTAEKRKKARRERRRVPEAGHRISNAAAATSSTTRCSNASMPFTATPSCATATTPYLNRAFFSADRAHACRDRFMVKLAVHAARAGGRGDLLPLRRYALSAATGVRRPTITACISRPATTRASTTASSTVWRASSRARRASTRSRAALSRR